MSAIAVSTYRDGGLSDSPRVAEPARSEYAELKLLVDRQGLLDRQPVYYVAKFVATLALLALGVLGLRLAAGHPVWWLLDAVVLSFAFVQIALLGHDLVHGQVMRPGPFNTVLSLLVGNLLVGVSRAWWNDNHSAHHAHPNDLNADPNVDILLLACTPEQAQGRPRWVQWILRHQVPLMVPIFCLEFFSMHQQSLAYVFRGGPGTVRAESWLLIAHYALYAGILLAALGPLGAVAFALVHHALTGLYMASIFAPNHKGMPQTTRAEAHGYFRQQVLTARNVRGGWLIDLVYGGLNYQIEHHLFPTMPRNTLRRATPVVRAYCAARGVPYAEADMIGSWREIADHFGGVSRALARST